MDKNHKKLVRRRQTLERKARFIRDVTSTALTSREIDDIGDTVLSFSEAKALATGNPLLMDKAAADAELARLSRAERAHHRTQDTLHRTITRLREHVDSQTRLAAELDTAIACRRDTRGDAFAMTVDGRSYRKRADAGGHLLARLNEEAANQLGSRERTVATGELGGFPLTVSVSRALGEVHLRLTFHGAPGAEITLTTADLRELEPVGLVSRLENRLGRLEASRAKAVADIEHARTEIEHATASLGKPFPQASELAAARQRAREIDEQLQAAAAPPTSREPGEASSAEPERVVRQRQPGEHEADRCAEREAG